MRNRILIVLHQKDSTPGKVGAFLEQRGYTLDRRCPCEGDSLPDDLSGYAASVVFGGPQSANDDHLPGIKAELHWLEKHAIPSGCAVLGICLGAQQIARVLGAKVGPHDDGLVEIGYWDVHPTGADQNFLAQSTTFYQWHSETFDIPERCVHLAENGNFAGQAFRYEQVYAIEFHPEMTSDMIDAWCESENGSKKLALTGAQSQPQQREGYARNAPASDRWLNEFLDGFLPTD